MQKSNQTSVPSIRQHNDQLERSLNHEADEVNVSDPERHQHLLGGQNSGQRVGNEEGRRHNLVDAYRHPQWHLQQCIQENQNESEIQVQRLHHAQHYFHDVQNTHYQHTPTALSSTQKHFTCIRPQQEGTGVRPIESTNHLSISPLCSNQLKTTAATNTKNYTHKDDITAIHCRAENEGRRSDDDLFRHAFSNINGLAQGTNSNAIQLESSVPQHTSENKRLSAMHMANPLQPCKNVSSGQTYGKPNYLPLNHQGPNQSQNTVSATEGQRGSIYHDYNHRKDQQVRKEKDLLQKINYKVEQRRDGKVNQYDETKHSLQGMSSTVHCSIPRSLSSLLPFHGHCITGQQSAEKVTHDNIQIGYSHTYPHGFQDMLKKGHDHQAGYLPIQKNSVATQHWPSSAPHHYEISEDDNKGLQRKDQHPQNRNTNYTNKLKINMETLHETTNSHVGHESKEKESDDGLNVSDGLRCLQTLGKRGRDDDRSGHSTTYMSLPSTRHRFPAPVPCREDEIKPVAASRPRFMARQSRFQNEHCNVCSICSKSFKRLPDLRRHIRVVHNKNRPFQCRDCLKQFGEKSNMMKHRYSLHGILRQFRCNFCDLVFDDRSMCNLHVTNVHKEARPKFYCEECGVPFNEKADLLLHYGQFHPELLEAFNSYRSGNSAAEAMESKPSVEMVHSGAGGKAAGTSQHRRTNPQSEILETARTEQEATMQFKVSTEKQKVSPAFSMNSDQHNTNDSSGVEEQPSRDIRGGELNDTELFQIMNILGDFDEETK